MTRRDVLRLGLGVVLGGCTDTTTTLPTTPGEGSAGSDSSPAPGPASGAGTPSPTSPPAPPPSPPPTRPGGDQIDLGTVVWHHADVRGWRQSSTVTNVAITDSSICIGHTMAGRWPVLDGGEGNPWIFVNLDGQWHAATYEWLRPGQTCKGVTRSGSTSVGRHTKVGVLMNWVPAGGEQIGLMVSTPARSHTRTSNERSNVVLARWP